MKKEKKWCDKEWEDMDTDEKLNALRAGVGKALHLLALIQTAAPKNHGGIKIL